MDKRRLRMSGTTITIRITTIYIPMTAQAYLRQMFITKIVTMKNYKIQPCLSGIFNNPKGPIIYVPAKLPKAMNHIDPSLLYGINKNRRIARELCLYFCSLINQSYFDKELSGVALHSSILLDIFGSKYIKIVNALRIGTTEKGSIIDCDDNWRVGVKSKHYSYSEPYKAQRCGNYLTSYKLKTSHVISIYKEAANQRIIRGSSNVIINNLYNIYPLLEMPTKEHLMKVGKDLAEQKKTSKKGKLYKLCNRNRSKFTDDELKRISFIEDAIRRFEYLACNGLMIPRTQGKKAGNRVLDFIVLLNSWIRDEITIGGLKLAECDFKCLHPNITISAYQGKLRYITHRKVAEHCGVNLEDEKAMKDFKVCHLAFFNSRVEQMKNSQKMKPIYEFYNLNEPEMLQKIVKEKIRYGHERTCRKLFDGEVKIMSRCIEKLNAMGIYVLYVYDALMCHPSHKDTVENVMNETVLECGTYTATYEDSDLNWGHRTDVVTNSNTLMFNAFINTRKCSMTDETIVLQA